MCMKNCKCVDKQMKTIVGIMNSRKKPKKKKQKEMFVSIKKKPKKNKKK